MTFNRIVIPIALAFACGGCGGSTAPDDAGEADGGQAWSPCLEWEEPDAAELMPPLLVEAPQINWRRTTPASGMDPRLSRLVLVGDRLAFVAGNSLWVIGTDGDVVGRHIDEFASMASGPLATSEGTLFFAGSMVRAIRDGATAWWYALGPNLSRRYESPKTSRMLLHPNGVLFFAATDGYLHAVHARTGQSFWKVEVGLRDEEPLQPSFGAGDVLFAEGRPVSAVDGALGSALTLDGRELTIAGALPGGRLNTGHGEPGDDGDVLWRTHVMDACGRHEWSLPNTQEHLRVELVAPTGDLLVRGGASTAYLYSATGERISGPHEMLGDPQLVGADGTYYTVGCVPGAGGDALVARAYASDLALEWEKNLGPPCESLSPALGGDGVLYLAREKQQGVEVMALQTQSPGLARTLGATDLMDNRRTGWVAQ